MIEDRKIEIWKDIKGYKGVYQISNCGNIRSLDRMTVNSLGVHRKEKGVLKKLRLGKQGYLYTSLWNHQKTKTVKPHRLVALYFIDLIEGKDIVNHKDGDKQNNHVDNLEWVTTLENARHAHETGLSPSQKGEHNAFHTLTEQEAIEVYKLAHRGIFSQKEISKMYNITSSNVSAIKRGCSWNESITIINQEPKKRVSSGRIYIDVYNLENNLLKRFDGLVAMEQESEAVLGVKLNKKTVSRLKATKTKYKDFYIIKNKKIVI
ncbi:NUMOD4 motif-containing HNH endonuclease [Clostridium tagluense]|uniref:HNH nuclease domain-containing protein n=1 Tax=Clostridium tagluense TaxID=360422 RepID=A0A401UQ95_9CLOT|nr:NUMOD4 motif-containing HNH endonuclease [Clostridium tagluense]GCD11697.1 hypothetical protein Ctaglu_33200 [Clostridium tagluense]